MIEDDDGTYQSTDDSEKVWDVKRILQQKGNKYKVDWEGTDPATGKPWPPSWVLKRDCTEALIDEWEKEKRELKEKKKQRKSTSRQSTSSTTRPSPAIKEVHLRPSSSRASMSVSPAKSKRKPDSTPRERDDRRSDGESVPSPSNKRRKIEINGRSVSRNVTYTTKRKKSPPLSAKGKGKQVEGDTEEEDSEPEEEKKRRAALKTFFGPKSVQNAHWKRQSLASLATPSTQPPRKSASASSMPPPRKVASSPALPKDASSRKRKRSGPSPPPPEDGDDSENELLAIASPSGKSVLKGDRRHSSVVQQGRTIVRTTQKRRHGSGSSSEDDDNEPLLPPKARTSSLLRNDLHPKRTVPKSRLNQSHRRSSSSDPLFPPTPPRKADKQGASAKKTAAEPDWDAASEKEDDQEEEEKEEAAVVEEVAVEEEEEAPFDEPPEPFDPGSLIDLEGTIDEPPAEAPVPAVEEVAPEPPKDASQDSNKSKESIVPDSQPSRASGSSNGVRSQSNPPAREDAEPVLRFTSLQALKQKEPLNPTSPPLPSSFSRVATMKARLESLTNPSSASKPLRPVPNITPSKFKPYLHLNGEGSPAASQIESSNGSPAPRQPAAVVVSSGAAEQITSQESERTDFSGNHVRERNWVSVGFKERTAGEKSRKSMLEITKRLKESSAKVTVVQDEEIEDVDEGPSALGLLAPTPLRVVTATDRGTSPIPRPPTPAPPEPPRVPTPDDSANILFLQSKITNFESTIESLETEIALLKRSKDTLEEREEFLKGRYNDAANRAAELARENVTLEKTNTKLQAENTRLLEQIHVSVAAVRLTLKAEMEKTKADCLKKENVAKLLVEQARRTGIQLPADDGTVVDVDANEVRRRAADWWTVKKERDAFEAQIGAYGVQFEEEKADRERREEVLNMLRVEEEDKRRRAVKRSKELGQKCQDLEAQLALAEQRIKEMDGKTNDVPEPRQDSPEPEVAAVAEEEPRPQEPTHEPAHEDVESEGLVSRAEASLDDLVFPCLWAESPDDKCGTAWTSKDTLKLHVRQLHVREHPLPDTAPLPSSSDPSNTSVVAANAV